MKNKVVIFIIALCVLLSVIFTAGIFWNLTQKPDNAYYSVFLDNNQVYFGKITGQTKDTMTLRDVYYLKATVNKEINNTADLTLYKMGSELHAPKDVLIINKTHILYYGELLDDSQIVKIINKQKGNQQR